MKKLEKRRIRRNRFGSVLSLIGLVISLVVMVGFLRREEVFRLWSEATGETANITIDVRPPGRPLTRVWAHLAQGGEDLTTDMLAPVIDQVKSLAPETIRIDHIYDGYDVVSRNDSGQLVFNWVRLDEVVSSIRKTGATPMLVLSYMPPAVSRGDIVDLPKDWSEWALTVQRTVEHYSGALGIDNVSYEVWNEPDLFGKWKPYGQKNYLDLYRWSAVGAGRANGVKRFKLGGPAITAPYDSWLDGLLSLVEKENLKLDFISWHRYSKSLDVYYEDSNVIHRAIQKHLATAAGLEWYLTETGPDSENNPMYDGVSAAAHLAAVNSIALGQINRVYTFEIVDGRDPAGKIYWGRWGLMTSPSVGIKIKPRYQVLLMLNRLAGSLIQVSGEGSWVKAIATKKAEGTVRVFLVNYDQYGRHSEETPVAVTGLTPGGEYSIYRTLLGGGTRSEKVIADAPGTVRTIAPLAANAVMFIEVTPAGVP